MKRTPNKIFIDANAYVAIYDKKDATHSKALEIAQGLKKQNVSIYTSSDVLGETLTVVSKKLGKSTAKFFHKTISESKTKIIFINEYLHNKAIKLHLRQVSKNISFIDCSSIVVMKENKIKYAFTFDKHFEKMGVKLLK